MEAATITLTGGTRKSKGQAGSRRRSFDRGWKLLSRLPPFPTVKRIGEWSESLRYRRIFRTDQRLVTTRIPSANSTRQLLSLPRASTRQPCPFRSGSRVLIRQVCVASTEH